ncbi:MAG TPA: hypothetical protein VGD64_06670 [Acidisarcina sp.]
MTPRPIVPTLIAMELHLSPDLETKLSRLAAQQGRDSSSLAIEAIERMVEYDQWFLAEVDRGLRQIEDGKTLSHEEVGFRVFPTLVAAQSTA